MNITKKIILSFSFLALGISSCKKDEPIEKKIVKEVKEEYYPYMTFSIDGTTVIELESIEEFANMKFVSKNESIANTPGRYHHHLVIAQHSAYSSRCYVDSGIDLMFYTTNPLNNNDYNQNITFNLIEYAGPTTSPSSPYNIVFFDKPNANLTFSKFENKIGGIVEGEIKGKMNSGYADEGNMTVKFRFKMK